MAIALYREDGLSSSTAIKGPCRAATTANITLSGEQTIDGVATVEGDRVLVRAQTNAVENGIYIVDSGTWRRAADFSGNRDVRKGSRVAVTDGTTYALTEFWVTTSNPITIDTTAVTLELGEASQALADIEVLAAQVADDAAAAEDAAAAAEAAAGSTPAGAVSDALVFWDVSESGYAALTLGAGLELSGSTLRQYETIIVAISDETTAIESGTAKATFRMPFAMTLTAVRASLNTASSSGTPTFDINEGGNSILSTKLTIDENEKTSTTAATAAVISDAALADDAEITIDIDVAGTGAKGAKIMLYGYRT